MKRALIALCFAACDGSSSLIDAGPATDSGTTTFCVGTAIDGTCAQTFLAPLAACLDASGACTTTGTATSGSVCWSTGAKLTLSTTGGSGGSNFENAGRNSGLSCFATIEQGSASSPYTISAPNGDALTYYPSSGMIVCPDNRTLNIGTSYGGCDAFRTLIVGPDFSSCTAGTCS